MYDQARTAYNVAQSNLKSITRPTRRDPANRRPRARSLAPTAGRVITVPVTAGTVVMAGDTVATVAEQNFVLRLEVPERHARYLKAGDPVRLDGADLGLSGPRFGTIKLIYPQVDNGHVVADATVRGHRRLFRRRARAGLGYRPGSATAIVVPENLIVTRSGIDYARLWTAKNGAIDVPVQRGRGTVHAGQCPTALEILSGLKPGDRLLKP